MAQKYVILEWDSLFFGYRIARFHESRTTAAELERVILACREDSVRCLYVLADAHDAATVAALESQEFGFKDIRMTYSLKLEPLVGRAWPSSQANVLIRPVQTNEITNLEGIACVSHTDTRFYFDHNFFRERVNKLYQTWIRKSCEGGADVVLVAVGDNYTGPLGYISCHLSGLGGQIGLVAVDECARGQGVGRWLLRGALEWFSAHNVKDVEVVTQGRNVPAQRLYQQAGFSLLSVQLWYHGWFNRFL